MARSRILPLLLSLSFLQNHSHCASAKLKSVQDPATYAWPGLFALHVSLDHRRTTSWCPTNFFICFICQESRFFCKTEPSLLRCFLFQCCLVLGIKACHLISIWWLRFSEVWFVPGVLKHVLYLGYSQRTLAFYGTKLSWRFVFLNRLLWYSVGLPSSRVIFFVFRSKTVVLNLVFIESRGLCDKFRRFGVGHVHRSFYAFIKYIYVMENHILIFNYARVRWVHRWNLRVHYIQSNQVKNHCSKMLSQYQSPHGQDVVRDDDDTSLRLINHIKV